MVSFFSRSDTTHYSNINTQIIVKELPERDRGIIMLYFGFYNNKVHTQQEIADMISISRSYLSRIITKIVKEIGIQLQNYDVIERIGRTNKKTVKINKSTLQLSTTTSIVDIPDQKNIKTREISIEKSSIDVEDRNFSKMHGKRNVKKTQKISNENNQSSIFSKEQPKVKDVTQSELISLKAENPKSNLSQTTSEIEKDDYLKILELMRTPSFDEMIKSLTLKEVVIIYLKFGYVDEKYFTTESIASFLEIETSEVIETTTKVLLVYKENMNQFFDKAVDVITGSSLVLKKDR